MNAVRPVLCASPGCNTYTRLPNAAGRCALCASGIPFGKGIVGRVTAHEFRTKKK